MTTCNAEHIFHQEYNSKRIETFEDHGSPQTWEGKAIDLFQEALKQSKNNNSQGPDKINIRHLKHIGPLVHIIPYTWKLANIVPIPKPNKDTDKSTPYRHISVLSVIAKTLEKSFLPYITSNTPMQHGYKIQNSTVTVLHTLNNTVAQGFNQMAPPTRTITVALDMSKAFDTINIHTLIRKLLQTKIPGTIIKLIANYNERKAYTTYIKHTSRQHQFKTGVSQGGVISRYLTFTPQTYHHPVYRFR